LFFDKGEAVERGTSGRGSWGARKPLERKQGKARAAGKRAGRAFSCGSEEKGVGVIWSSEKGSTGDA
jgi:hypothetical protein